MARAIALGLLARREHSCFELERKLCLRRISQDIITRVLEKLKEENLQSDARFAASFVRVRIEKASGPVKIRAELRARGVDAALINEALADYTLEWEKLVLKAYMRRFGSEKNELNLHEKAKRMRFLQMRGFSNEQIRNVFKTIRIKREHED